MSRPPNENVFHALSHPTRRKIVELLVTGDRPAQDLRSAADIAMPTLSEHLRVLRTLGLVSYRRRRTSLVYRLNAQAINSAMQWLHTITSRSRSRSSA